MTDYMIIAGEEDPIPGEARELLEGRARFAQELQEAGTLRDAERLRPSTEGRRVSHRAGNVRVEPGPFAGALGSYWVVSAADLDGALALARGLPTRPGQSLEVRPVMKGRYDPVKTDKTGKVFGFGVLGNAPNEEAWIRVMNEIDDTTQNNVTGSIAGVRLEAPRTGRHLLNQAGKNVVLDGPFLESKEVIGGLFFMRLPSIDDAVQWASSTPFVRLGTAEIREVWRG